LHDLGRPSRSGLLRPRLQAFIDGRLRSVARTFFVGDRYEDVGGVTESPLRGRA